MLSRREKYMLALLPPMAIVCVQAFVLEPSVEARIQAAEARLVEKDAARPGAAKSAAAPVNVVALHAQADQLEKAVALAEKRAPALVAKWTKPERRAQVVSDLARLFESNGVRLRASGAAPASEVPEVTALMEMAKSIKSLGGAEPEAWRFEISGGFQELLSVLAALDEQPAFVLPLALQATPHTREGRIDVVLWAWI